jgi:hypothetical protein
VLSKSHNQDKGGLASKLHEATDEEKVTLKPSASAENADRPMPLSLCQWS